MSNLSSPGNHRIGRGSSRFVLGYGSSGTFGAVELILDTLPVSGQYCVKWEVVSRHLAFDARERSEKYANDWLRSYTSAYPEFGLALRILEISEDSERFNDYERAISIALLAALKEMKLPIPQIFSITDAEFAEDFGIGP